MANQQPVSYVRPSATFPPQFPIHLSKPPCNIVQSSTFPISPTSPCLSNKCTIRIKLAMFLTSRHPWCEFTHLSSWPQWLSPSSRDTLLPLIRQRHRCLPWYQTMPNTRQEEEMSFAR
jgi:hypothetical protein